MIHPDINIRPLQDYPEVRCDCMGGLCACGEVHGLDYVDKKREEFEKLQAGEQEMIDEPVDETPVTEDTHEVGEPSVDSETIVAVMGLIANWLDKVDQLLDGMIPTEEEYMYYVREKTNLEQILNTYYGGAEGMDLHVIKETLRHAKASIKACKNQPTRWLEEDGVHRAAAALRVAKRVCDEALPIH